MSNPMDDILGSGPRPGSSQTSHKQVQREKQNRHGTRRPTPQEVRGVETSDIDSSMHPESRDVGALETAIDTPLPQYEEPQVPRPLTVRVPAPSPATMPASVYEDQVQPRPEPAPEEMLGEEFNPSPVPLRALLEHHLAYYAFPPEDTSLIEQTLSMVRTDRRCRDKHNWIVLNPEGRDFLTVTNDKELSRAAGMSGTAVRLSLIEMLDQQPVPLGQILVFRDEFREFLRPCSHLIALQLLSKALVAAITKRPVSRDYLLDVKSAVAQVYERRHRTLTVEKLASVSLAVIADAHPRGLTWPGLEVELESLVLKHASNDF